MLNARNNTEEDNYNQQCDVPESIEKFLNVSMDSTHCLENFVAAKGNRI